MVEFTVSGIDRCLPDFCFHPAVDPHAHIIHHLHTHAHIFSTIACCMAFGPITVQFRSFQNNYRLLKPSPIILKSSKPYSVFFSLLLWPGGGGSVMESMLSGPFVGDTRSLVALASISTNLLATNRQSTGPMTCDVIVLCAIAGSYANAVAVACMRMIPRRLLSSEGSIIRRPFWFRTCLRITTAFALSAHPPICTPSHTATCSCTTCKSDQDTRKARL